LRQFDGAARPVGVLTDPPGLAVQVTYNGLSSPPAAPGTYAVRATVLDPMYSGSIDGTLVIASPPTPFETWLQGRGLLSADPRYAPDSDDDLDGATTWAEFIADTDPADSGSVLVMAFDYVGADFPGGTGEIRLAFPASTNRFYQLEYRTNLLDSATGVLNLGRGAPGMVVTNRTPGAWFGAIRARLTEP
jgi:hypothetical protein